MATKPTARFLTESEYADWNTMVAAAPSGSIYSTPEYLDILCRTAGGSFRLLGAFQGDELVGGVALFERPSPAGVFVANRLLLYYNGLVLKDYATKYPSERTDRQFAALAAIEEVLSGEKYARLSLHNRHTVTDLRPFFLRNWRISPDYSYVVSLSDMQVAWGRVEQNLRRLINRATEKGVVFTDDDDFGSYYAMHTSTAERKGAYIYLPREKYESYFRLLYAQGTCKLFQARMPDGRAVASQLVLTGRHPVTHTVSAAADGEFLNIGVNPFLRWRSFEALAKLGHTGNDLTDAFPNPVSKFKGQLGGDLVMNSMLSRPDSAAYRWMHRGQMAVDKGKVLAGRLLKRVR